MNATTKPKPLARPLAALVLATLTACSPGHDDAAHPHAANPSADAEAEAPNRVRISAAVRSNLGLTFAKVEARRVAQTLRVPGAFELQPLARREYRMALPGRVEFLVDQYDSVEVGQLLYRFQSPTWPELLHEIVTGEQATGTALAEIDVARAALAEGKRKAALMSERIASLGAAEFKRADLDAELALLTASLPRLEAELRLAETRLTNARRTREHALHRAATASGIPEAELEREVSVGDRRLPAYATIDWIDVSADAAGVVERLAITTGAFIDTTSMILSTIDPKQLRFRALGLQSDLPRLIETSGARIVAPQPATSKGRNAGASPNASIDAKLTLGLEAHPDERTLTLLATPLDPTADQAPWVRPGVSAFLEIELDSSAISALAIPTSAVVPDGLSSVFFRRDPKDPNAAIRVEADLGLSDGRWVVVQSGVMLGDEVVLAGAYELKLALDQREGGPPSSGHVHADGSVHTGDE